MSDREEFENWLSGFLEFDVKDLERTRYTDDDGMQGYIGLEKRGHTEDADDLASIGLQAWQAARAQGFRLPDEVEKDGLRDPVNLAYCDGWNDCRKEMLSHGMVRQTSPDEGEPQ